MPTHLVKPLLLLASLSTPLLGGCSILTTDKTDASLSAAAVATAIGHVRPSRADTCDTQVQVAEQSSKIATLQTGKEVVYKPLCETDPKATKRSAPPAPVKTSSAGPTVHIAGL